jgi:chemotaxis protein MotB
VTLPRSPVSPAAVSAVFVARMGLVGLCAIGSLGASGCVTKVRYEKLVADSAQAKLDADAKQKEAEARIQALQDQITAIEATVQDRDAHLSDLSTQNHNIQAELDEQTAMNEQLRGELGRLGKDVDKILADKGTLAKALDDAKARLDELRKAQAAGEARVALFRDFERRFKPLIDAGQLRIDTRRGQLVVVVPGDVLFDAGRSEVRGAGKGVLMEIARTLQIASVSSPPPALTHASAPPPAPTRAPAPAPAPAPTPTPGRRYLVTADVDPVVDTLPPPEPKPKHGTPARAAEAHKPPHPRSAWDLSADQAVAVVEYLASLGVPPETLTAAGAGSFDPVAPGDDSAAHAKNRRIEIALLPDAPPP